MKLLLTLALMLGAITAHADYRDMKDLARSTQGSIYAGNMPSGYRAEKIESVPVVGAFKAFLTKETKRKMQVWRDFVYSSDEFDNLSREEKRKVAANPLEELRTASLLEVGEAYAIYKGDKFIGYYVEVIDHVQGAIYQDGAWFDLLLDPKFKIVSATEQSA